MIFITYYNVYMSLFTVYVLVIIYISEDLMSNLPADNLCKYKSRHLNKLPRKF